MILFSIFFFFQAEDGIRDLVRSRGLGDVYKRQEHDNGHVKNILFEDGTKYQIEAIYAPSPFEQHCNCLLYTSDAADERSSVDLGGRRIIKKKNRLE